MSFAEKVKNLLKSFGGGEGGNPDEGKDDPDLDDQDENGTEGDEGGENMSKSDLVDATEILGDLVAELKDISKSLKVLAESQKTLEKSQCDVGEAVVSVGEMVAKISGTPISPKSVMAKGNLGGGSKGAFGGQLEQPSNTQLTQAEFERAQDVLVKSVQKGEITMQQSEMISSDMQKSMGIPGYKMKPEYFNFIAQKMRAA